MEISSILPAFNEEDWIELALQSLCEQTVPSQIIVVDSESTDQTAEIAQRYTPYVFRSKRGKLNAKNLGVLQASGEIVVMADADCYYSPDFLERITMPFGDPDVVMVAGDTQVSPLLPVNLRFYLFKFSPGSASAYRRNAFLEVGGYDVNVNQTSFYAMVLEEQIRFNWRIMHLGRCVYEPSAKAYHQRPREVCILFDGLKTEEYPEASEYCEEIIKGERF